MASPRPNPFTPLAGGDDSQLPSPQHDPEKLLKLTFGVELEFGIEYHDPDQFAPLDVPYNPHSIPCVNAVRRVVFADLVHFLHHVAGVPTRRATEPPPEGESPYAVWQVGTDETIDLADEEFETGTMWAPVELKTRIMRADNPAALAAELAEIRHVIAAINHRYNARVNRTCGVHVHVGNSTVILPPHVPRMRVLARDFPFETVRALAVLVTACERPFQRLHAPERQVQTKYCRVPSATRELQSQPRGRRLDAIADCQNLDELYQLFNDGQGKYYAYNLQQLVLPRPASPPSTPDAPSPLSPPLLPPGVAPPPPQLRPRQPTRTIEFRQHAGSLQADRICAWVELVCGLLDFAHRWGALAPIPAMLAQALRPMLLRRQNQQAQIPEADMPHVILRSMGLGRLIPQFPVEELHPDAARAHDMVEEALRLVSHALEQGDILVPQ
jgi:hypothetical protein